MNTVYLPSSQHTDLNTVSISNTYLLNVYLLLPFMVMKPLTCPAWCMFFFFFTCETWCSLHKVFSYCNWAVVVPDTAFFLLNCKSFTACFTAAKQLHLTMQRPLTLLLLCYGGLLGNSDAYHQFQFGAF